MTTTAIQFISDEAGEPTAVIVPIDLWRDMLAELETTYLLRSPKMRERLLQAVHRTTGMSLEEVVAKLAT